jgi:hypothetical protein
MRITVGEILPQIAQNVGDSGTGLCDAEGIAKAIYALNQAAYALHKRIDDDGTLWWWHVPACGGCFALPADCREGRQFFINGFSATQYDEWYSGKVCGGLSANTPCCEGPSIIDLGDTFATPFPLPGMDGLRVGFVAQSDADAGKEVIVEFTNQYGETMRENLLLPANQLPIYTKGIVRDVSFIQKPVTVSNVKLYYKYPNDQRFFMCDYEPKTIVGKFRRKRMPGGMCNGCNVVSIKGKRRYIQLTSEADICPFDDIIALRFALSAIAALDRRDSASYDDMMLHALNEIYKQMRDGDSPGNVAVVKFRSGFGCSLSQFANRPVPGTNYTYGGRGFR